MLLPIRQLAFVLASTDHGTMIVNINDDGGGFGVGQQIFSKASCDREEIEFEFNILNSRKEAYGNGVFAIDCGANIGTRTIEWAKYMSGWGEVYSFEAQKFVYYALAGNVALNNCFNATPIWSAIGSIVGTIDIPVVDYRKKASFGSLEIQKRQNTENIGQSFSYDNNYSVPITTIDSFNKDRVDYIKIDVEGMEIQVLDGAKNTIEKCKPVMFIETLKTDISTLHSFLNQYGYNYVQMGINLLAVHNTDKTIVF